MDDYASLAGPSVVTDPHGRVSGLTPKRRLADRKKHGKNKEERREEREEDVIVAKNLQEAMEHNDSPGESNSEQEAPDEEDEWLRYGGTHPKKRRGHKIDVLI